ncbi:MAG: pyocin knob domain-containing protein [Clostridiales bacterium]|nr:pyocin knob domain-containing protein [Clostridiales bacterium]
MTPKITGGGISLMIRALDGEGITFSKMALGNGELPDDYSILTNLVNPLAEIGLDSYEKEDAYVLLKGTLANSDVEDGFNWTEIGVFCTNPDGGDDILYAYGHYQMDGESGGIYIPQFGSDVVDLVIKMYVYVGSTENVAAALAESSEYATQAALKEHIEDDQNPHDVTKEQVGLGNVPNVTTNNQTPTFSLPTTLNNLASGATLSTQLGKLALAIKQLITHFADSTIHITSSERTAWNSKAAASHTHSTTDITSGTLGLARGGTGATSAEGAAHSIEAIYAGTVSSTYRIASGGNLDDYTAGGTYWCAGSTTASTLSNCPYTDTNFTLLVFRPTSTVCFQMLLPSKIYSTVALYFRAMNSSEWGPWMKTATESA